MEKELNNKPEIEVRTIKMESRFEERDGKKFLVGHAAVFDEESRLKTPYGEFDERVMPGAFVESISQDDVRSLFNHDENIVLGRNSSGTLKIWEDQRGLAYEVDLPDTQSARDLKISIERGDISQGSFSFYARGKDREIWEKRKGKPDLRKIIKAKLYDVGPVTFPQYEKTDVAIRSHKAWKEEMEKPPAFTLVVESYNSLNLRRQLIGRF